MKPRRGARAFPNEESERGAKECWLNSEYNLWLPIDLAQHYRKAAQDKGHQVHDALDAGGPFWDVQRRAIHNRLTGYVFHAVGRAPVVLANLPCRIVRRSGDH